MIGLEKGDLIFGVNDARVETIEQFRKIIDSKPPVLAMKVLRGDETLYLLFRK